MKTFTKNILAFLALMPLAIVSCTDEIVSPAGEPELEGCYKVFFPAQENSGAVELAPEDPTVLTFTVRRDNEDGDITVPVNVTASAEDVFEVSEIIFEDGQTETSFTVSFPNAEIGVNYSCNISVTDPQYAAVYGVKETYVNFSVVRIKWNLVTGEDGSSKAIYRDDIFSSAYNVNTKFAENEIEIYERSDMPGYYRIKDLYTPSFMSVIFYGDTAHNLSSWFTGEQYI